LLTLTMTMPVYVFFSTEIDRGANAHHNPIVAFVVDIVLRVIESLSSFVVQGIVIVLRSTYSMLPVLILIVLMSILNANLDTAMPVIVMAYNKFVVETNAISMIRRLAWIFKLTFEIFTPLYNWSIESFYQSGMDILKLLVDNEHNRGQITTIVQEIGTLFITVTRSVVQWMMVNFNECQHSGVLKDLTDIQQNPSMTTALQHRCFDFDYLDLDLSPVVMVAQKIVTTAHSLSTSLCPSLASASALALYPLYDKHMGSIVQNSVNLAFGVYYTTHVTQMRCRGAFALSLSTTLCAPDLYPMFRYVERITESVGLLVDNWLNIGHMMLLSFFMDRDASVVDRCSTNGHTVGSVASDSMFGTKHTRILSSTASLLAVTDGRDVIYLSKQSTTEPKRVPNAFRGEVDVSLGVAAVDFASTMLETDHDGDAKTGILGCQCVDSAEQGAQITCRVALYPAFFDPEHQLQEAETRIPLVFERGTTGKLLSCRYLRISVQSIRFPAQVFDVSKHSGSGGRYNHNVYSECMADPRKCNQVDAAVYVMPLCPRYTKLAQQGQAPESMECIQDSKYQTCFPYCVALHQKGAGNTPMMLYNKRSLAGGVYMANTRVARPVAAQSSASGPRGVGTPASDSESTETCLVSSQYERIEDMTSTTCVRQTSSTAGTSSFSNGDRTMRQPGVTSCTDVTSAPCEDDPMSGLTVPAPQRATALADSQPFLFAGDIILVPHCQLDRTECSWTTSLHRITSDVHAQYSIVNKLSDIPSIRTSDANAQSEHGGVIFPGETNDVINKRNPAAQTRTGIVYGVNPNPLPIRCLLQACVLWSKQNACTEISCTSCYQKPQVFFTQPLYTCSSDKTNTVRGADTQRVRACHYNTTTEIKFELNDKFWSTGPDFQCDDANSATAINLYIEDIVYLDDLNVVISVRRGPVEELMYIVGLNTTAWPADRTMQSRTLHYFLNMETLQIRKDAQWTHRTTDISNGQYSILCQSDTMVPIFGTLVASTLTGE